MINLEPAFVERVIWSRTGLQCLQVKLGAKKEKALNYPLLTGPARPGEKVVLNTTAVKLGLGSGGYHYVILNYARERLSMSPAGHIIKLRYTPLQLKVKTFEETWSEKDPLAALKRYGGLQKTPVVLGELHSMVAPFVLALKKLDPERKISYIMTDSAALPLHLSDTIYRLQKNKLLNGTVTCGHAFGGDLETVNLYTALIAAREELKAEIILITPGPGVVGTGTFYGFSGIELGEHIARVGKLQGLPIVIPRLSFADSRARHYGLSHHTLTALDEIASREAFLPLPALDRKKLFFVLQQMQERDLFKKHKVIIIKKRLLKILKDVAFELRTMGRKLDDDPAFFAAAAATAWFVVGTRGRFSCP